MGSGGITKKRFLAIFILAILLSVNFLSLCTQSTSTKKKNDENPWMPEDEGAHFPMKCEWWMFHVALELENGAHWDASATFQYDAKKIENETKIGRCTLLHYYFNRENGKCYDFTTSTRKEVPLSFKKNIVDIQYHNCTIKGLYPEYQIHLEDDKQNFILDIEFNALTLPHWAIQEGSQGYIPWGFGWARYGYITRLGASGYLAIDGKEFNATGFGYYEHAWGNFTYNIEKPLQNLKEFINYFPKFLQCAQWYLSEISSNFLQSRTRTLTTNNLFGYDWAWAAFDNGWSLHFGSFYFIFDCVCEGRVPGMISFMKGEKFFDFADITIKYGKMIYIEETDVFLPLDFELHAYKDDKLLYIKFNAVTEPYMCQAIYPQPFSCGFGGIVTATDVDGYFNDGEKNFSLHGISAVGSYRQFLYLKHNTLRVERLLPPQGLGFSVEIISHSLRFKMLFRFVLCPTIEFCFYIRPLDNISPGVKQSSAYRCPLDLVKSFRSWRR